MRKFAYLREPLHKENSSIYKIMLYETEEGFCLFEYSSLSAVMSCADLLYEDLNDLYEEWSGLIDEHGWIDIEDPLPDCQHDAFLPLRVKGRNTGNCEWGKYEVLKDGRWVDYDPEKDHGYF